MGPPKWPPHTRAAPPAAAVALLDDVAARLAGASFTVHRSPFGWFTRWDLQAKGHPLSRVARTIVAPDAERQGPEQAAS